MPEPSHPSDSALMTFVNGFVRQREGLLIESHLQACTACAMRLSHLESESLGDHLLAEIRHAMLPEPVVTLKHDSGRWNLFLHQHERFHVLGLLSHDAEGPTYLAEDKQLRRKVTLSVMSLMPGAVEQLEKLIKLPEFQQHTRIVSLSHLEVIGTDLLIVNRAMPGSTLCEVVCSHGRLPLAEILLYIDQVCEALTVAHTLGITHGDLQLRDWVLDHQGISLRGWERMRAREYVPYNPSVDIARLGPALLGLLLGRSQLHSEKDLPWGDLWPDVPLDVVPVLQAMTHGEYPSVKVACDAFVNAAIPKKTWKHWFPFRFLVNKG